MRSYIGKPTDTISQASEIARLLADPTRLRILQSLFKAEDDICVNEIAEFAGSSHSATSHQLAKLEAKGIVECFREGQKMCYKLTSNPSVTQIEKSLHTLSVI